VFTVTTKAVRGKVTDTRLGTWGGGNGNVGDGAIRASISSTPKQADRRW
jgi:hypothetical protein